MTDKATTRQPMITTAEACELIGIDKSTLSRWVQSGRIAYVQKLPGRNGAFLFDPTEVERVRLDYKAGQVS